MDGWLGWGAKLTGTVAVKATLNIALPGLAAAVDFGQAAYDLYQGDTTGAVINTISGVAELLTFGFAGSAKKLMEERAKEAAVLAAKQAAKQAEKAAAKKVGQEFAKTLATGMVQGSKAAAIQSTKQTAKAAGKEATKTVGKMVSKEFAKGVVNEAVEDVWRQGTKTTLKSLGHNGLMGFLSSGGHEIWKNVGENVYEPLIKSVFELTSQNKMHMFQLTADAAKTAAGKEFMKNYSTLLGIEYGVAAVKGGIRKGTQRSAVHSAEPEGAAVPARKTQLIIRSLIIRKSTN